MKSMEQLIISKLKTPFTRTGSEFIMTSCLSPAHNDKHPSFAINLATGRGKCFGCGHTVSGSYWTEGMDELEEEEMLRAIEYAEMTKRLTSHESNVKSSKVFLPPIDEELDTYRGLSETTLKRAGIYVTKTGRFANRVIFPIYYDDTLVGFTGRTLDSSTKEMKYLHSTGLKTKSVIYPYNLLKGHRRIYVVEGVMDALSLIEKGFPAMCNFGVADNFTMPKVSEMVRIGIEEVYLMFDKDKAGEEAEIEILQNQNLQFFEKVGVARLLPEFKEYYESPFKDYNEYMVAKKVGIYNPTSANNTMDKFSYIPPEE
jgi:DNA primase